MKTPDKIKEGLECCKLHYGGMYTDCSHCPYYLTSAQCDLEMHDDALALIQQLESKLNQAVEDIRMLGRTGEFICPVCAHFNHGEGTKGECVKCLTGDGFEWRGSREREAAD